ncbi:hypothetical protein ACIQV2_11230 [Streptomyces globosus]|uniref:hypothetical protein n=1 Tax=Streptomyces globosus TaxID=68209 RepID=UPI003823F2F2
METPEATVGVVRERPSRMGMVRLCAAALLPGRGRSGRDAGGPGVRHSAGQRQALLGLAGAEAVAAFLLSSVLPPALRTAHGVLEGAVILGFVGAAAALRRAGHHVAGDKLVVRTGLYGEVSVPRAAVGSVGAALRSVPGRGPRPVPGDPAAVACSAEETVNVAVRLRWPVRLDLGDAGVVQAETLYADADCVPEFRAAVTGGGR